MIKFMIRKKLFYRLPVLSSSPSSCDHNAMWLFTHFEASKYGGYWQKYTI